MPCYPSPAVKSLICVVFASAVLPQSSTVTHVLTLQLIQSVVFEGASKDAQSQSFPSSSCILKSHAFLAFLGHFKFWMGIWNVLRCNGLEILNPKHMWKSENGPLQPILATKRYVTFFWATLYIRKQSFELSFRCLFDWLTDEIKGSTKGRSPNKN